MTKKEIAYAIADVLIISVVVVTSMLCISSCSEKQAETLRSAPEINLNDVYPKMGQDK